MPRTSRNWSTERNPPRRSRVARIAVASDGPMPGSASSSACDAVLRSIGAFDDGTGPPDALLLPVPSLERPPAGTGLTCSPTFGTYTRAPSTSLAARSSAFGSAPDREPPAALIASMTRAPNGSVTTPGRATAPATETTTMGATVFVVAVGGRDATPGSTGSVPAELAAPAAPGGDAA